MEVLSKELLEDMYAEYWVGGKWLPVTDGSVCRIYIFSNEKRQLHPDWYGDDKGACLKLYWRCMGKNKVAAQVNFKRSVRIQHVGIDPSPICCPL